MMIPFFIATRQATAGIDSDRDVLSESLVFDLGLSSAWSVLPRNTLLLRELLFPVSLKCASDFHQLNFGSIVFHSEQLLPWVYP